jgi:hypothetical protein
VFYSALALKIDTARFQQCGYMNDQEIERKIWRWERGYSLPKMKLQASRVKVLVIF